MSSATIYKLKNQYLVHADRKTKSGFSIASEPYFLIPAGSEKPKVLYDAIMSALAVDESERLPDPQNWSEFKKEYLSKTKLKSLKELEKSFVKCLGISSKDGNIVITPSKRAESPDRGFLFSPDRSLMISNSVPYLEVLNTLDQAFARSGL